MLAPENVAPRRGDRSRRSFSGRAPNRGLLNVQVARDQRVRPIRKTPGVNRGYQKGTLGPDGRLARFTAACSPLVYRGDALPSAFRGDAFVCEPAGNLVKRNVLVETASGPRALESDAPEFLASTDERFRPVHLMDGPDGALYVVDFYRGVIQHRVFVTTYLRRRIVERGLESPTGLGRIWRIVPEGFERPRPRRLRPHASSALVDLLQSPNGWCRDTAQRLLVERQDRTVEPALRRLASSASDHRTRLHALWTLEGLGRYDHGLVGDLSLVKLQAALTGRWVEGEETAALLAPYEEWQGLAGEVLLLGWARGLVPGASADGARIARRRARRAA